MATAEPICYTKEGSSPRLSLDPFGGSTGAGSTPCSGLEVAPASLEVFAAEPGPLWTNLTLNNPHLGQQSKAHPRACVAVKIQASRSKQPRS